jgi:ribosomal protein L11 methyltransferase
MSFGTGHHATTYLMMQQMRGIDFTGKAVFDFGTGTGVLAILAEKLGANSVLAIDNDDWSMANAEENIIRNNCNRITLQMGNTAAVEGHYDIILANINKNVILDNMEMLADRLNSQGLLILSGLLVADEEDILANSGIYGLKLREKMQRDNWLLLKLSP